MVKSVGEISVEAILEDKKFKDGIKSLITDLDKSKKKGNEFGVEISRIGSFLGVAGKAAVGLGASLLGFLTAGITQSSTFKENWAGVDEEISLTSEALGQEFAPEIRATTDALIGMLKYVRDNKKDIRELGKAIAEPFVLSFEAGKAVKEIKDDLLRDIGDAIINPTFWQGGGTLETAPYNYDDIYKGAPNTVPKQAPGPGNESSSGNLEVSRTTSTTTTTRKKEPFWLVSLDQYRINGGGI